MDDVLKNSSKKHLTSNKLSIFLKINVFVNSFGSFISGIIIGNIPALYAASIPAYESSNTKHFLGEQPKLSDTFKNISGSGFDFSISSPHNT